ncbi:MAG TPA: Mur ligase domain-containing protein, partial [Clostridia bacterium]|nr:Mur ligase domain-containing protein [Clostridia bacterium]
MLDFSKIKKAHFLGIGGISMSALALLLVKFGVKVSGADRTFSEKLLELSDAGVKVYVGSHPEAIGDAELVVYSSAIHPECEELE